MRKYNPNNVLGWSEYQFAVVEEMLLNTFIRNNHRAPDFLIKNHNDNWVIINREENKKAYLEDKVKSLEAELTECKKALEDL